MIMSEATINGQAATAFVVTLDTENTDELEAKERKKKAALRKLEEKRKAIQAAKVAAAAAAAVSAVVTSANGGDESNERNDTPTLTSELPPEIAECNGSLLSDSATYLINRMLESDQLEPSSLESEGADVVDTTVLSSHQTKDDPEDSGVCEDSRSETGTYTLAVEHKNVDVEHARQMIDVVFGVSDRNRCNMPSGRLPESTDCTMKETEKSQASSSCNQDLGADIEMLRELRQRTFTRADSRRSSEDKSSFNLNNKQAHHHHQQSQSPSANETSSINCRRQEPLIKGNLESKIKSVFHSERSRHDSAGSSRTIEIKAPTILRKPPASASNSPLLQRKHLGRFSSSACSTPRPGSTESLTGSFDSDPISTTSGLHNKNTTGDSCSNSNSPLKLNRAFALRRARLGIETPGVPLNLTEEKQKKNLENKNRISPGNRYGIHSDESTVSSSISNFNRRDGGRFSLRAPSNRNTPVRSNSHGKPPIASQFISDKRGNDFHGKTSQTVTPTRSLSSNRNQRGTNILSNNRNFRANSESKAPLGTSQRVSPASSTCSISHCQSVQRSCSFGPASNGNVSSHAMSPRASLDYSSQFLRGMSPLRSYKRIFNSKTHQITNDARQQSHRQQANVVPIKRSPSDATSQSFEISSPTPSASTSCVTHKILSSPSPSTINPSGYHNNVQHTNTLAHQLTHSTMTCSVNDADAVTGSASSPVSLPTPSYLTQNQTPGTSLSRSGRSLSALDSLVLSAILQLSMKLRNGMKELLHQERLKHPPGSETRMMVDEILPQVASLESLTGQQSIESMVHENLSKDLSSILKNLKRVEQSIEGK